MARVVINGASVAKFMATDPTMQKALGTVAASLAAQARDNTPIGSSVQYGPIKRKGKKVYSHRHGFYRDAWDVRPYRGGFRVSSRDPFFHLIEWGSIKNSAYAPIRRAVRASGLRYKPNPDSRGA